eukprot:6413442-Pyramimonas_sp.AAC.1
MPPSTKGASGWAGPWAVMSVCSSRGAVTAERRLAGVVCRQLDVESFIGAVFHDMGASLARAGLAW